MKTRPSRSTLFAALAASALAFAAPERADAGEGKGQRRGRHGPPPEAVSACEAADEGSQCGFVGPRGHEVSGACDTRREQLVCVPENRRHRGKHGDRDAEDDGSESLE